MGASANAGNLPAFARAPALPLEVAYVRRVAQCLPRCHLRFRHEVEVHWRLRHLFAADKGPIPFVVNSLERTCKPWMRGSRSDLQSPTFVSSAEARFIHQCVSFMFLFTAPS